jgi:hypothetical protein
MNITHGSILAVFFSASPAEIQEGEEWYARANRLARELGERYNIPMHVAAGVIAALSPNNRWERNTRDAEALIRVYEMGGNVDACKVSTFGKNKAKAIDILMGAEPLDVLGGLKVRAFYSCIIGGNDVCVDGHAYSIWLGQRVATFSTPKISERLYCTIAADYCRAAQQINQITGKCYTGAQVQAITWVTWRNLIHNGGDQ